MSNSLFFCTYCNVCVLQTLASDPGNDRAWSVPGNRKTVTHSIGTHTYQWQLHALVRTLQSLSSFVSFFPSQSAIGSHDVLIFVGKEKKIHACTSLFYSDNLVCVIDMWRICLFHCKQPPKYLTSLQVQLHYRFRCNKSFLTNGVIFNLQMRKSDQIFSKLFTNILPATIYWL
jgi:hypothetical protein